MPILLPCDLWADALKRCCQASSCVPRPPFQSGPIVCLRRKKKEKKKGPRRAQEALIEGPGETFQGVRFKWNMRKHPVAKKHRCRWETKRPPHPSPNHHLHPKRDKKSKAAIRHKAEAVVTWRHQTKVGRPPPLPPPTPATTHQFPAEINTEEVGYFCLMCPVFLLSRLIGR